MEDQYLGAEKMYVLMNKLFYHKNNTPKNTQNNDDISVLLKKGNTPLRPGAVAESVEHWSRVWKIMGSNPGRVKPMTYKIDTCRFLTRCSAL